MKKTLVLLLSLMMVLTFALASCGGGDTDLSDSQYVGEWVAKSVGIADEKSDIEGGEFRLTLNGDGTGTFVSIEEDGDKEVSDITWSLTDDGFRTKGDTKLTFTDNGDGITTKVIGVELNFVRASEEAEEESGEPAAAGAAYGYAGDDPAECACYKYMVEVIAPDYAEAEISIPTVNIFHTDYTPEDEVLMYGDFWVENYNANGDTLECVSGGNHPGIMHVSKADNTVTAFDQVADGEGFEESAKELFGEHFDDFMSVYSDSDARNELRRITVSDYVNLNGLDFKYYQDPGWDPVELYRN